MMNDDDSDFVQQSDLKKRTVTQGCLSGTDSKQADDADEVSLPIKMWKRSTVTRIFQITRASGELY